MNDAMYIAATGMQTQQSAVDTIANNMANASTPGFKASRVNFQELMYRDPAVAGSTAGDDASATGALFHQGTGVGVASLVKNFAAGTLVSSANPLDLAIKGDGFVEVQTPDGGTAYWRGGTLQVTSEGWLATARGELLKPQIRVDKTAGPVAIAADGTVTQRRSGSATDAVLGQLPLQVFASPTGLKPQGDGLYLATTESGEAITLHAADSGAGSFAQSSVEQSNVSVMDEVVNLMMAQRAYEMNVKVIQAADELAGMSNNLRR